MTSIKIDPYLNIDAGTMSPFEHGEVFVLDDGGEADLDLGNYERFNNITLTRDNNITTGKIYQQVGPTPRPRPALAAGFRQGPLGRPLPLPPDRHRLDHEDAALGARRGHRVRPHVRVRPARRRRSGGWERYHSAAGPGLETHPSPVSLT